MSAPAPPEVLWNGGVCDVKFPDDTLIKVIQPTLDSYGRLWAQIQAFQGDHSINDTQINLLNQRDREDFQRVAMAVNGSCDWISRLLVVTKIVQKELHKCVQEECNVWAHLKPAPAFLGEQTEDIPAIVRDLIFPGCVSLLAAPRGIGKSMSATCLAVALALGGRFRDDDLDQYRVALIDRDNPPKLVRIRLRHWGAEKAESLHIMAGEAVPKLTDKTAWDGFPAHQYDLVVIDSIGSATEGVDEREGKQTQLYLRTLRSLAERGPAILGLLNTTKSVLTYRGRGEVADRVDVLYEVRDVTGWVPEADAGDAWWLALPEAGEHGWQDRARRRRGQARFRLAFVPSKFRLGLEPEPFALEISTVGGEWSLADITASLSEEAHAREQQRKQAEQAKMHDAVLRLLQEIAQATKEQPVYKTDAISLLHACGLPRKTARNLVEYGYRDVMGVCPVRIQRSRGGPGTQAQPPGPHSDPERVCRCTLK